MTTPPSFPVLAGQGWSVHKRPTFSTRVAGHVSGREVRSPFYAYTLYEFELTFEGLSSGSSYPGIGNNSLQSLMGLYLQCEGQYGTFLYTDPTDNAVANQGIGTGDGTTISFTFQRALGGFLEPVSWVSSVANVYLNGAIIQSAGFSPPAVPMLSSAAGGTLAAATYYVKVTYVTASGETLPSSESSLAVAANNLLAVTSPVAPSPPSAIGWNAYVAMVSGNEVLQNGATPIAIGTNWTEPTSGLVTGTKAPPAANTTGWSITQPNGFNNTLTFNAAPANGAVITADFSYAFVCRFLDDQEDFENFMNGLWQVQALKFRSVKP